MPYCGQKEKVHLNFQHWGTKKASFVCAGNSVQHTLSSVTPWAPALLQKPHEDLPTLGIWKAHSNQSHICEHHSRPVSVDLWGRDSSLRCPNRWDGSEHFKRLECDEVVNIWKPRTHFFAIKSVDWNLSVIYESRLLFGKKGTGAKANWGRRRQEGPNPGKSHLSRGLTNHSTCYCHPLQHLHEVMQYFSVSIEGE